MLQMWEYGYTYPHELYHYGVKGMKWGVRRTPEQLGHKKMVAKSIKDDIINMTTANGVRVQSISKHQIERANERGIHREDIIDALSDPLEIKPIKKDENRNMSQRFIGRNATVNVNPQTGTLITTWKTSTKLAEKLERKKL